MTRNVGRVPTPPSLPPTVVEQHQQLVYSGGAPRDRALQWCSPRRHDGAHGGRDADGRRRRKSTTPTLSLLHRPPISAMYTPLYTPFIPPGAAILTQDCWVKHSGAKLFVKMKNEIELYSTI